MSVTGKAKGELALAIRLGRPEVDADVRRVTCREVGGVNRDLMIGDRLAPLPKCPIDRDPIERQLHVAGRDHRG